MLLNDLKADTPSLPSGGPGARLPLCLERVVSCADLVRSRSGGTQQISVITVARPASVIGGVPTSKPGEFPVLLVAPLGGEEPTFLRYLGPHSGAPVLAGPAPADRGPRCSAAAVTAVARRRTLRVHLLKDAPA